MALDPADLTVMCLPEAGAPDRPDLATLARTTDTRFVLAVFTNLAGKPCAKLVPVEAVEELQEDGVGFAGYAAGAMGQVPADPDLVAVPDAASFTPIPFVRPGLALVHCDPHVQGEPWPFAPRVILKKVLDRPATSASRSTSAPRSSTSSSTATGTVVCAPPMPSTPPGAPATTLATSPACTSTSLRSPPR